MRLQSFTSEYEAILSQSAATGRYWVAVYKSGGKTPELETEEYEDWEDAMSTAMHFIEESANREFDEAQTERYSDDDLKPDTWSHPDE
jgi:hypothetical protein